MNIYIINNPFHYEIENLTRAFFNNEKMNVIKCDKNVNREKRGYAKALLDELLLIFPKEVLCLYIRLISQKA